MDTFTHSALGANHRTLHRATVRANDGGQAAPGDGIPRLFGRYPTGRKVLSCPRGSCRRTGATDRRVPLPQYRIDPEELARSAAFAVVFSTTGASTLSRQYPRRGVLRVKGANMLQEPMMEKLLAMRLNGMASALKTQEQDPGARELSFLERLALLIDHQWNWRQNQALA